MSKYKFEVMHDPRGFFISIGKYELIAKSAEEVIEAFRHWANKEPHNPIHTGCPLCGAIKEEQDRLKLLKLMKEAHGGPK